MKKDVIYIDIEDDITSIIDKVKNADAPIVAVVPPKRIGALQSTVNLRLLQRSAENVKKRIVLITNDRALIALASTMSLPIAKNLQSKPEIAPLTALDTDDGDVINGEELPVGDLAEKTVDGGEEATPAATSMTSIAAAIQSLDAEPQSDEVQKPVKDKKTFIPDFDSFRKKLFIFGGLGVVLIAFLVWALFFAAKAEISVTARTNLVNINKTLTLRPDAQLDASQGVLPVQQKQVKKTTSVDFKPTGEKQVGEKATGSVEFKPTANSVILNGATIPSGTTISSGSCSFTTSSPAVIQPTSFSDYLAGKVESATVSMVSTAPGAACNDLSGSVSGAPSGTAAKIVGSTSGGTDKVATVVSAEDITKASEQLKNQDSNVVKQELAKEFSTEFIVITEAYIVESGNPTSTPAVDQEATAAKLTQETTYTLLGIKRADLKAVYDAYLKAQVGNDNQQKVYKSGDEDTQFSSFQKVEGGYTIRAIGNAQVGPNIDGSRVANDARGKRVGEVQQTIGQIQGVDKVDVSLSPFWINRVPNETDRITVSFSIKNE